jgi:YegS/Rv2252/BmrU family lipid kinase
VTALLHVKSVAYSLHCDDWPETLDGFSDVWIVGGDGTLHYFINKYPECSLPLAIFPGGTGNDFCWELYGNTELEAQVEKVLSSPPRPVDAGLCNGRLFLGGTGIGFDGQVLRHMHFIRLLGGHLGYYLAVLATIFAYREPVYVVEADGAAMQKELLLLMVNNARRTGGGFLVSPDASVTDGLLNLMVCEPLPVLKRIRYLPRIQKGTHLALPFVGHSLGERFSVLCPKPMFAQIDGEMLCADRFEFSVVKGKFLFRY